MSTTPPGPGWWLASDGNWYPPEQAPGAAPPPPPPAPPAEPTQQQPAQPAEPAQQVPQQPYGGEPTHQVPQQPYGGEPTQQVPQEPQPPTPPPGAPVPPPPGAPVPPPPGAPGGYPPPAPGAGAYGAPVPPPPGAPLPPGAPSSGGKSKLPWIIGILVIVVAGAVIAGVLAFGGDDDESADTKKRRPDKEQSNDRTKMTVKVKDVDPSGEFEIEGDDGSELNQLVREAIVDLQAFWSDAMPHEFDTDFEPISGGYWAWTRKEEVPPCAQGIDEISGNAFYCSLEDNIAWDAEGLLPDMMDRNGPLAVGAIMAHEWGHAVQARVGMEAPTVVLEQQADCYAGSWLAHLADDPNDAFPLSDQTIDGALSAILEVADQPGTAAVDPNAHGSAFDRANAFQDGIENGVEQCADYSEDNLVLVELPFDDQEDYERGGNLPYDQIMEITFADLEDYWSIALPQFYETEWKPLSGTQPFVADGEPPTCGGEPTRGYALFYCVSDDTIAWDDTETMPAIAEQLGDYAVGTLIGTQYGLAVMTRLGVEADDTKQQNLTADCLAGAWAASVFSRDRETSSLQLSPGDLDESVKALLNFGGSSDSDYGTGFERVSAFRTGVMEGPTECVTHNG